MNFEISNLPLYWRFFKKKKPHNSIPSNYKFTFNYDKKLGLISGNKSKHFQTILKKIYKEEANIGYMLEGHNLARSYGGEFFNYILKITGPVKNKLMVDVGCGGCGTLYQLKKMGAKTLGIDPSPIAAFYAEKYDLDLINSYFPKSAKEIKADVIFSMDLMEHVLDPVELLKKKSKALNDNGIIIINVPNCEFSIKNGDISMAIHQHVNMFDRWSLKRVVDKSGLEVVKMDFSKFGSALFCVVKKRTKKLKKMSINGGFYENFFRKVPERIKDFKNFVQPRLDSKSGFFIFQRALPYLAANNLGFDYNVYDNNSLWHNKFLDGVPKKIKNQEDCLKKPPKNLFIISDSFSNIIKKYLKKKNSKTKIYTEKDIFNI